MKPTILLVEDITATRKRIEFAIRQSDRFKLIGSVKSFYDAIKFIKTSPPDILLTDLDLPDGNGVDLIKLVQLPHIETKMAIVISVFGDNEHVINALKAGASGYLMKSDDFLEINDAISQMLNGGAPISPYIARHLLNELTASDDADTTINEQNNALLTPREMEVLTFVSKGYTSKEIAEMLDLSYHTVREYVSNIYKKLSVKNRTQAVFEAKQLGLL